MTEIEVRQLLSIIDQFRFNDFKINSKEECDQLVNAWHFVLVDYPYEQISIALKQYLASNNAFSPKVGQLIEIANNVADFGDLNEIECATLILKAVSNSTYNSESEFNKLPPIAQRVCGSPSQLRMWATDDAFNRSVVESNIQRVFRSALQQEHSYRRMSPEMKLLADAQRESKPMLLTSKESVPMIETATESCEKGNLSEKQIEGYMNRLREALNGK